jgi:membrane dipeptidase
MMYREESSMNARAISVKASRLVADSLVWDNTFPFGPSCGSQTAHERMLHRMRDIGYSCVAVTTASDNDDMASAMRKIAIDNRFFRDNTESFVQVDGIDDVLRAQREGKLAIISSFQGTLPFDRDAGFVEMYYKLGVRQALMAYNQKNNVGDGCHERTDAGLSRLGIEVVREMNRVGMLVDCSHTGYRTTMDVFEVATSPVIFSHSNSRALVDNERNIHDDQALACARTGGVIGINGVGIFLGENDPSAERTFAHVDHFVQLVGADHVGFGIDAVSDTEPLLEIVRRNAAKYPAERGYQVVPSFGGPELIPQVTEHMLRHGYGDAHIRGILGENWLRVAKQVWK